MSNRLLTHNERMSIYWKPEKDYEGRLLVAQDAKSIAARDKWWIERIEKSFKLGLDNLPGHIINAKQWQQLKREVGQ